MQRKTKGVQIFLTNEYDVTLNELLKNVNNENSCNWCVYFLEDVGNYSFNKQLGNPYSDLGYEISWIDLKKYSEVVEQIIFGVFIGSFFKDIELISPDKSLYEKYEYYFEMIDGAIWIIFTKDEAFYEKLISSYKCKIIEPDFQDF